MSFLLQNLRRSIVSSKMLLALGLTLLSIILGNIVAFQGEYSLKGLSLFFAGSAIRGLSPISLLAAIICTLPCSSQIMEDATNHLLSYELQRMSKIRFLLTIITTAILTSFIALALPYFCLLAINLLITPYQEIYIGSYAGALKTIFEKNQLVYSILTCFWYGFWGGVFSLFGLASAQLFRKKVASLFVPIAYMLIGGTLFAILGLSYLEPVGTIAIGYQQDLTIGLIFLHLAVIGIFSVGIIFWTLFSHPEDYV